MNKIWLSIGSNINKEENVKKCILSLKKNFSNVKVSSIYQTSKVNSDNKINMNDSKSFFNLVSVIESNNNYNQVLKILKNIEEKLGRKKDNNDKYFDRVIDIDILLFNDEIIIENNIIKVPHKELGNCFYVDIPLLDLDPFIVHPLLNKTIQEIVNKEYLEKSNNFIKKIN